MLRAPRELSFGAFLIALALLPWSWLLPLEGIYENAQVADAAVGLSFALWVVSCRSIRIDLPLVLGSAILLIGALALAVAPDPHGGTAAGLAAMAEMAMLFVLAASFARDRDRMRVIAEVVALSAAVVALAAAAGAVLFWLDVDTRLVGNYGALEPGDYPRVQAGFEHPALLGSYAIFAAALAACAAWPSRRARMAIQAGMALAAILSLSRGTIGFAVALAARRGGRPALVATAAGAATIAVLTIGILRVDVSDPLGASYDPFGGGRWTELRASLETIGDRPLLGIGPNGLPGEYQGDARRAHFTPVQVAGELGLPALILLVALGVAIWRRRARPTNVVLWAGVLGLLIDGLGQDVHHFRHFWILLGLAYASSHSTSTSGPS